MTMHKKDCKMGAPKLKWTPEEEAALRAGVEKYGPGKWRAIQKDENFGPFLTSRTNVDLKDKWRNMSVSSNGLGATEKAAKALVLMTNSLLAEANEVGTEEVQVQAAQEPETDGMDWDLAPCSPRRKTLLTSRYDGMIMEAICSLKDPSGCSKSQIVDYIEGHHTVPSSFRSSLTSKLKVLTLQRKLLKRSKRYTVNSSINLLSDGEESVGMSGNMSFEWDCFVDASRPRDLKALEMAEAAAQAIAEAEAAAIAAREAAKLAELAEAQWEAAEAIAEATAAFALKCFDRAAVRALPRVWKEEELR